MDDPGQHTAVHEAGHAVIGRKLGMAFGDVTIIQDLDSAGHHRTAGVWETWDAWEKREKWRDISSVYRGRIMTFMAGAEAEKMVLGTYGYGDGDDRYQIGLMLEERGICERVPELAGDPGADEELYLKRLRSRTAALVKRHRLAIQSIAEALVSRGKLSGDEVDKLLR